MKSISTIILILAALLLATACNRMEKNAQKREMLRTGAASICGENTYVLQKLDGTRCGKPYTGFQIFLNPKGKPSTDGGLEVVSAEVRLRYEVEPPNECQNTWSNELSIGFAPDFRDVENMITFATRESDGKPTRSRTSQLFCSYYDDSNLSKAVSCLGRPNNRHENVELMAIMATLYEELRKEKDGISLKVVCELFANNKMTREYWKNENQSARELAYRQQHPDYVPYSADDDYWSTNELNDPITKK